MGVKPMTDKPMTDKPIVDKSMGEKSTGRIFKESPKEIHEGFKESDYQEGWSIEGIPKPSEIDYSVPDIDEIKKSSMTGT